MSEFAVDTARARDFAADLDEQSQLAGGRHVWSLVQVALRAAFRRDLAPVSPNADFNAQIAAGVLAVVNFATLMCWAASPFALLACTR